MIRRDSSHVTTTAAAASNAVTAAAATAPAERSPSRRSTTTTRATSSAAATRPTAATATSPPAGGSAWPSVTSSRTEPTLGLDVSRDDHHSSRRLTASSWPISPSSRRISSRWASALPTSGPGPMPRCSITCDAVELGADGGELLALRQLVDARLQLVHPPRQPGGLALVARRAVAAGQHVELGEQLAGVAHVAAHGRVAPAHLVGVEAQVQEHQLGHRGDVRRRVAQRLHAPAGHARPDHVVVVERGALARLVAPRARLADVVEQRGEPGDAEVEVAQAAA